jgi:hypothetical protein
VKTGENSKSAIFVFPVILDIIEILQVESVGPLKDLSKSVPDSTGFIAKNQKNRLERHLPYLRHFGFFQKT